MSGAPTPAAEAGQVLRLAEVARLVGGRLAGDDAPVLSYAIDSRAVRAATLFVALAGERTDGHRFLDDVASRGAAGAVVRSDAAVPEGLRCIRVGDPRAALRAIGRHFRDAWPLTVIGITGSAGKTTTKEHTANLIATQRKVFRSAGNLNSEVGLPLTLTRRRPDEDVAVLELGMSQPGELRRLAALARPDIAIITNVGLAHVGNFKHADDIATEKESLLAEVPATGSFVANADDGRVRAMARRFPGRVVLFGCAAEADVRASGIELCGLEGTSFTLEVGDRRTEVRVPLIGRHHVSNVLAGLAAAMAMGLDPLELAPASASLCPSRHRGVALRLKDGVTVLDDCYNASPQAVAHALDLLGELATAEGGRRIAVLGDMLELGEYAEVAHREAGRHAAMRANLVVGVGAAAAALVEEAIETGSRDARHVPDAATAAALVVELVQPGDTVLVKGSRGIGLEVVVEELERARG